MPANQLTTPFGQNLHAFLLISLHCAAGCPRSAL
jgi:hypothetical protein